MKERERDKMLLENLSIGVDDVNSRSKLKYEENYCTFLLPKANNN